MKLYYAKGACSLAPHIALHEAGLSFTLEPVNLQTKRTRQGDYTQVNPKGYVPALELDDGSVLTEAQVILQYIAAQKPEKSLLPKDGFAHFKALEWLNFTATEVHKGFGPLWHPELPEAAKEAARTTLAKRLDVLSKHLEGKSFVLGSEYSVVDAYLFTVLSWAKPLKFDLAKWPPVLGLLERVGNRPATQAAMKEEGLLK